MNAPGDRNGRSGLLPYKSTPVFDENSLPQAIRSEHRTKPGTWGMLRVLEGHVTLVFTDPHHEIEVTPRHPAEIAPQATHFVRIDGPARLQVEFYHEPPSGGEGHKADG